MTGYTKEIEEAVKWWFNLLTTEMGVDLESASKFAAALSDELKAVIESNGKPANGGYGSHGYEPDAILSSALRKAELRTGYLSPIPQYARLWISEGEVIARKGHQQPQELVYKRD